ncbi:50S ribosomal protein L11 methyltransferase [Nibricoccus aquaticus]|uniref:Ribosomal protein L11 methyltransferase n=1 Tax=Nibricoccus aquaticus TaxID=2576891 RepID=A0A290Q6Z7_9BACT|nr:50S ribosomal protein L11 methyltransferase [Nibricoccus aquaticus]ATC64274.1 50S ribosomal protein L11 methyltransferase [Nibricoccus aquaticus]
MELFEIKAEIPVFAADETDNVLLELGVEGWSLLEDAIAKRAWIVGVFTSAEEADTRWEELRPMLPAEPLSEPERRALGDRDWKDSYKAHFKAWKFGRLHWVPIWEREAYALPAGEVAIWLDPGLAFGTGNHETTRLCIERLIALEGKSAKSMARVIDAGCGSGILALSAAKLGYGNVEAFDNDPEAVRVSEENAAMNGAAGAVKFFTGDLVSGLAGRQAEIVLANIQADVLMRFAKELIGAVAPGGALILSGILAHENEQVRAAFVAAAPGWTVEARTMGEWSDVLLVRPV